MGGATLAAAIAGTTGGAGAGVFDFSEGSGTVTIPTGATGVTIEVWGGGGGGGFGTVTQIFGEFLYEPQDNPGGGGGSGAAAPAAAEAATAVADALVTIVDQTKCTNCKTCYQDIPELFEKTRMVINGESREVARLIPGALEKVSVTPELKARIKRVSANCDAEIIR